MPASYSTFLTLVLVLLLTYNSRLSLSSTHFNPNLICTLLVNGTKIKDPRACNAWIECIDGQPITGTCAVVNDFYDRNTLKCVPAQSIGCVSSDACATITANLGFVADPYTCNGYYYCTNGVGARGVCNPGMNFNPGTQACVRNFPCVDKMHPDSYCNILPDGVFIKNIDNCNGYQLCWDGVVVNSTCPDTFDYNPLKGICDYAKDVHCVEFVNNPPNAPAADEVCAAENDFVGDNNTCNGYYVCRRNAETAKMVLVHATCPAGRFFAASNDVGGGGAACVPRSQVPCNYDRCVGLGTPAIQLANLSADDCQGFALCQDGVEIGTGACPENEYFDEVTQRCTTDEISYPACMSTKASTSVVDSLEPTSKTTTEASSVVDSSSV